ncbi:unnamed protein product [Closterium sp. NIES-53]
MGLPTSARTSLKRSTSGSTSTSTMDSIGSISASIIGSSSSSSSSSSNSSSSSSPQPETPAPLGGAPLQFRGGTNPRSSGRGSTADQRLEELLAGGTGEGVRAKYAARLQEKKMLAEARREQQGGGFGRAAAAVASAAAAASTAAAAAHAASLSCEEMLLEEVNSEGSGVKGEEVVLDRAKGVREASDYEVEGDEHGGLVRGKELSRDDSAVASVASAQVDNQVGYCGKSRQLREQVGQ